MSSKKELEFWSRKMGFHACTNIRCALPKFTTVAQAHSKVSTTCRKVCTKNLFHQFNFSTWIEMVCKTFSKMQNICKVFPLLHKLIVKSPPFVGKFAPKIWFISWNLVHEMKWFVKPSQKCKIYAKFSYPWTKFYLYGILAFQTKV